VADEVSATVAGWPGAPVVVRDQREKYDALAASNAALAASGTIALELAMAGLPMVISYRVAPLTHWIVKRMIKVRYACLVNIVLDRGVVPELLQDRCRPDLLQDAVGQLLDDPAAAAEQRAAGQEMLQRLGLGGPPPSRLAARCVIEVIARQRSTP
jgi:lipid-A-disaccharide synthase